MLNLTYEPVRWSSRAASELLDLLLQDRRAVLAATSALTAQGANSKRRSAAKVPSTLQVLSSIDVHYRVDGAGILVAGVSAPYACTANKRKRSIENRRNTSFDSLGSDVVLLSKDEYNELLERSAQTDRVEEPVSTIDARVPARASASSPLRPLLTDTAFRDARLADMAQRVRAAPSDGTIPQEVLERAAQNYWPLPRAWREYLGLTKQEAAARACISAISYGELEEGYSQICSARRQIIARGLSLLGEQLLV